MGHVVDEPELRPRSRQQAAEHLPDAVADDVPVAEAEVGRGGHGGVIAPPLGRGEGRAGELAVGQGDPVAAYGRVHGPDVVGADLVAQAARAGVDQHGDLAQGEAEPAGHRLVVDDVDDLDLHEVVSSAERAELVLSADLGAVRHLARLRPGQRPARLDVLEVLGVPDAVLAQEVRATLVQDVVELVAREGQAALAAVAGGNAAADLVDHRLQRRGELLAAELGGEQPHPAVDVEADSARRDDAVRQARRRHPAHGEAVSLVHVRHAQGGADDPRERGHVDELPQAPVAADLRQKRLVREDARGHPHVRPLGAGHLVKAFADLSQLVLHRALRIAAHTSTTTVATNPSFRSETESP